MKKLGSLLLCFALVLGVGTFGGCGNNKGNESAEKTALVAHYAFDEGSGGVTRESVSGKNKKIAYVFAPENQEYLYKQANDPLWRQGVSGKSLYMDGYSTYIEDADFANIRSSFTVSAFVAPRAFEKTEDDKLTGVVCKGDPRDGITGEGFTLGYGDYGVWGLQLALQNPADELDTTSVKVYDPAHRLARYEWNHIAASYSEEDARVTLYLNGEISYQTVLADKAGWKPCATQEPLIIGRSAASSSGKNTVAGLIDEVRVYEGELSVKDMRALYTCVKDNLALSYGDVAIDDSIFATDRYRPQYHAMPNGMWMNEPHAPFYYKGKYHLFFQHNALALGLDTIEWGHLVSDDMVNWKQIKNAVVRDERVARAGVWTGGSVIGPDGAPWLVVTAGTDRANGSAQNVAFAHPVNPDDPELTEWKIEECLGITQQWGAIGEFRDPFVWCDNGTYYLMIGCTDNFSGGAIHIFTSPDMRNWTRKGYLYEASQEAYPELSNKWECNIMLPVHNENGDVKYALMVLPQRPEPNYTELYYWLGRFDKNSCRFIPDDPKPRLLDYGRYTFNGQTGLCYRTEEEIQEGKTYEEGRTVLFALAQGRELDDKGWMHNVSLPVELKLNEEGNALTYAPIEELDEYTGAELAANAESMTVTEVNELLKNVHTDCARIRFTMTVSDASETYSAGLDVRYDGTRSEGEYTRIAVLRDPDENSVSKGENIMTIERGQHSSQLLPTLEDSLPYNVGGSRTFTVTVYLDRSMLEVYVNDTFGFTTRVYPKYETADGLRFVANGCTLTVRDLSVSAMKTRQKTDPTPAYYGNVA